MQIAPDRAALASSWNYAWALLLGFAIAGAFLLAVSPGLYLYIDPDSSGYLEAARNFMAGKGLLVSAQPGQLPDATAPLMLWPPGYPLMIALGAKALGLDPLWLAPRIAWLCWILMPVTLLYGLRPVLRDGAILAIGALVMLAPGTLGAAPQALSDVPFLFLTVLSLALFFRGVVAGGDWRLVLLSGFVGGLAYSVRNVGLALFASIPVACFCFVLLGLSQAGETLKAVLWWFLGATLVLLPLEIRNLAVFGTLQPYHMPPSTLGLGMNVHYYVIALFDDLIGRPELKHDLLWNNMFLAAALLVLLILMVWLRKSLTSNWEALSTERRKILILLITNILAGSAIVILARSRYQWGEFINVRHLMQYDWMILAAAALFLAPLARTSRAVLAGLSLAALALLGVRVSHALTEIAKDRAQYAASLPAFALSQMGGGNKFDDHILMQQRLNRDKQLMQAIAALPPGTLLLSNRYESLRVESGRPVTRLELSGDCKMPADIAAATSGRTFLLLFPDRALVDSGCWARLAAAQHGPPLLPVRSYLTVLGVAEAEKFR